MKEKKDSIWKKIWNVLDGNKTIIGSNVITILVVVPIPEPYKTILIAVVGLLTGIAFRDHIQKGFFKQNKGQ